MLERPRPSNPVVELLDEVLRINGRLKSIFSGINAASGLSSMESTVLTAVVGAQVAPTVPQIGRSLGHPRQVIQRAANALIEGGLIETAPNPHHKRAPLLLPTRRGQALNQEADARADAVTGALLRRLDAAKCLRLADELRELRYEIEGHLRSGKAGK